MLIPAAFTPFDANGSIHPARVAGLAQLYLETGLRHVFINGTTGESSSLSVEERLEMVEVWTRARASELAVWVHVGHNAQREAIRMAAHAATYNAKAISARAPSYLKPGSPRDLAEFLAPVAAAAPGLPFYYYHIPSLTGLTLPIDEVYAALMKAIPTLAGMKYSSADLVGLQACMALAPASHTFLFGSDEMLLAALPLGVDGAIGSTYNYAAPLYQQMQRCYTAGDLPQARALQQQSVALVKTLIPFNAIAGGKALMGFLGVDCGDVRPPLKPLTEAGCHTLYEALQPHSYFARPLVEPTVS